MRSNLIYDIGMHTGEDTSYYLEKGFKVVAIEANPDLVLKAHAKFSKYIKNEQLVVLNFGLHDRNDTITFYKNSITEFSSFIEEFGTRGGDYEMISIKCITIDMLLMRYGTPYYMKIDIEGLDGQVIKRLDKNDLPKFISLENGNGPILDILSDFGYSKFKFINQSEWNKWKCPFPPVEGEYVDYEFVKDSSGLFGEETGGGWYNYNEIKKLICDYWDNPNRNASIDGWYDLHATL